MAFKILVKWQVHGLILFCSFLFSVALGQGACLVNQGLIHATWPMLEAFSKRLTVDVESSASSIFGTHFLCLLDLMIWDWMEQKWFVFHNSPIHASQAPFMMTVAQLHVRAWAAPVADSLMMVAVVLTFPNALTMSAVTAIETVELLKLFSRIAPSCTKFGQHCSGNL